MPYPFPIVVADDPQLKLGDRAFIGLNMRLDPSLVSPGYVAVAENARCRDGVYESRLGYARFPWMQKRHLDCTIAHTTTTATVTTSVSHGFASGDYVSIMGCTDPIYNGLFAITVTAATIFTYTLPSDPAANPPATDQPAAYPTLPVYRWTTVHGRGNFSDPFTTLEYLIIAADGAVFACVENNSPQRLALPAGVTITGPVEFTQAFDSLIMWRGFDLAPLSMPRISTGFLDITPSALDGEAGLDPIPASDHGLFFQNRVWVPNDRDELAYSDLGDYTRYLPVAQEFKLNQGSADAIVGITKFGKNAIVVGKEHRIIVLTNVYGNLASVWQDELTDDYGVVGRKTFVKRGRDLWFLTELGVMSIIQTDQNELQGTVQPRSEAVQPIIDRVNWPVARSTACAATWDSKFYLALPLDSAEMVEIDLFPKVPTYDTTVTIAVTLGAVYRLTFGANDTQLVNGSSTYTKADHPTGLDFTAAATTVTLTKADDLAATATLRRLYRDVNTHILVHDAMAGNLDEQGRPIGAWVSLDSAVGLMPQDLFVFKIQGRDRLCVVNSDGNIYVYEEQFEDALNVVYSDFLLNALPTAGDYFTINRGSQVTVAVTSGPLDFTYNANLSLMQAALWNGY